MSPESRRTPRGRSGTLRQAAALAAVFLILLSALKIEVPAPQHQSASEGRLALTPVIPRRVDAKFLGGFATPSINVYGGYSKEPAPMGAADYGLGPSGAYQYSTNSSLGSVSIVSLSTKNSTGSPAMSFQLNVNLQFYDGSKLYVYWVQDVVFLDTSNREINFEDNIWNSSTPGGSMNPAAVSGYGQVLSAGNVTFYGVVAAQSLPGNFVALSYPSTVALRVNSSVSASSQPTVTFEYNDGYGWQEYDAVHFPLVHNLSSMSGFVVDGFAYNPAGLFYDSELTLGGPGGGGQTTDIQSDVRLQLEYWNGHNYQLVANAYNFGSDTAEGITNAISQYEYFPANGGVIAEVQSGAGTLGKLWDQSRIGVVDLKTSLASGTLEVRNSSSVGATPGQYAFANGEVTVILQPGSYQLGVYSGASLLTSGKYSLAAGQLLQLRTPLGIIPLTFSYSVVGGGSGYSPPVLTYSYNGTIETATLGSAPTVYDLDSGSTWSVSAQLPGSGPTQRWETAQPVTGAPSAGQALTLTYYHQYLETASYSVAGGGSGYSNPALSGQEFGASVLIPLGTSPTTCWLDSGTTYSAANPLSGSTPTERWFSSANQGTVTGPGPVAVPYEHQFLLTLDGGGLPSQWYDSGTQAVVSQPDTYGRSSGTGQRLTSFTLDSGQQTPIPPTKGNTTVGVVMNGPHVVSFSSVTQYDVSLSATVEQALSSISPPTVSGDSYWYDSGSAVNVALFGTWGRSSGEGSRLATFSINAGPVVPVTTKGTVEALSLTAISSPQVVTGTSTAQFFLTASTDALASITPPPIAGDTSWYDNGTSVVAQYEYVWNASAGGSRLNAISYSLDQGGAVSVPREGSGTFAVTASMSRPRSIGVDWVTQYSFDYSGGFNVSLSIRSPTADGFYDANSNLTISSDYVGDVAPGQQRQALTAYTLDSRSVSIPRNGTGAFTTSAIVFDAHHSLTFDSVLQYFVAFSFTDSSGLRPIAPSSLAIEENSPLGEQPVPGFNVWIDNGTAFTIAKVTWEGADVKPLNATAYTAVEPLSVVVHARVYDATLKVVDYLGLPVSGAGAAVTLANGTGLSETTNAAGEVSLRQIPLGTFDVTVTSLGVSSHASGDASTGGATVVKTYGSYVFFGAVLAPVVAVMLIAAVFRMRRSSARRAAG